MNDQVQEDLMVDGFHKLDTVEPNPPKVTWGVKFLEMEPADQIAYLKKLASAMNHAAFLIQEERNQLLELCRKQEAQIKLQQEAVDKNNQMLQQEVSSMNEKRQVFNKEIARLNALVRELGGGDHH
jgi:hypothetical protein